jgi:hypothetical protein
VGGNTNLAILPNPWMSHGETEWLIERAKGAETFAEIGCWQGITTRNVASNCKATYYAVEHFEGSPELNGQWEGPEQQFQAFLSNTHGLTNVKLVPMKSVEAAKTLSNVAFDVVFIDAAHDYDSIKADVEAWAPLVKSGGILCGHDYGWFVKNGAADGVTRYVRETFPGFRVVPQSAIWYVKRGEWTT